MCDSIPVTLKKDNTKVTGGGRPSSPFSPLEEMVMADHMGDTIAGIAGGIDSTQGELLLLDLFTINCFYFVK